MSLLPFLYESITLLISELPETRKNLPLSLREMENLTLTGMLTRVAGEFPRRRALSASGKFDLTYARLQELIESAASRLVSAGINVGDVVALVFPNTVEVLFLLII